MNLYNFLCDDVIAENSSFQSFNYNKINAF